MRMQKPPSTPNANSCADRLKALADETRLAVVQHLMKGECHVGDIQAALGIEQSLLSHHLRNLREAGIVESARDGIVDLGCCRISFEPPNRPSRKRD